jgi:hypothetical protein
VSRVERGAKKAENPILRNLPPTATMITTTSLAAISLTTPSICSKQNKKMSVPAEKVMLTMAMAGNRGDARAAFTTCLMQSGHLHPMIVVDTIRLLIKEYPQAVRDGGKYQYLALHETCAFGCPLDIVKLVYKAYPEAI